MSLERCDILVVGGGPAGSSLAWGLRDQGLSVCILDRQRFPRDKTCAGWITPQVLESLAISPELYAKGRTLQPIHGFRVGRMGSGQSRVRSSQVVSYGIRRCELDHFLLERSEARLRLGEGLRSLERRDGLWRVNGAIEAPLLVGAGGHFCPVARRLARTSGAGGAARSREPLVAAQEMEFPMAEGEASGLDVEEEVPELHFTADLCGYGWVFRKGRFLNVGLGRRDSHRLSEHFAAFLERLRCLGKLPPTLPRSVHGHAYLLYGEARRPLRGEGVALLGDAAGLAYPRSGEGIRPAVESGLLLARALRGAASPGDPAALQSYERLLRERLGPREGGRSLLEGLPEAWVRSLAGRLFAWPAFARRVVVERWFLHAHVPALRV